MKMRYLNRTIFVVLVIASQMFGSTCSSQNSTQSRESTLLARAEKAASNDNLASIRGLEPKALGDADSLAERQGRRLTLHLKSGTTRVYEDSPECQLPEKESKCQMYVLIAHVNSLHLFVLAKLYYESAEYLLVDDATGGETSLRSFPKFSPSGRYALVLLVNDEQVGFAVQIWRREGHGFILDWSGSPHVEGFYTSYALEHWFKEDSIALLAENRFEPPKPNAITHFELHHVADGWEVVEAR
jgi:hypothetical protein